MSEDTVEKGLKEIVDAEKDIGLLSAEDLWDNDENYEIENRIFAEVLAEEAEESFLEEKVDSLYENVRELEIGTKLQGGVVMASGSTTMAYGSITNQNFLALGGSLLMIMGAGTAYTFNSTISMSDYLPEREKSSELQEYRLVSDYLTPLIRGSDRVDVIPEVADSAEESYERVLRDYHGNEPFSRNNLQLVNFEENDEELEYRIETYSSGLSEDLKPEMVVRGKTSAIYPDYEDIGESAEALEEELLELLE